MSLFCFWANFKTIYGGKSPNTILFNPQQKKGKKGTKKGKSGFWSKIVQKSQNSNFPKNPDISYPFYPFYPFWSKTDNIIHFPFPPYFWSQNNPFRPVKVPFCEILKNWPPEAHFVPILRQKYSRPWSFFAFWSISKPFAGQRVQTQHFWTPSKKRVKRVPKRVNLDFGQKSSKNLKIQIFIKIQIYRTPFTLFTIFDKKLVK